jgi:predicted GNAT family N-acyltransferase
MHHTLHPTTWAKNKTELALVRRLVFIEEQHVPKELEWDEHDETCHHILVTDNHNNPVATGRIKPDGHIGRMAVLKSWRNQGVGSAVLNALLEYAIKNKMQSVYLHAQTTAIPFYEKHGFMVCSDEFMDAGIPHKTMQKIIAP